MSELTLAIEALCKHAPLVLHLEDIHWSDVSTLSWLTHVMRRLEPARLLILATVRPADRFGPRAGLDRLVGELGLHGQCHEIDALAVVHERHRGDISQDRLGESMFGGELGEAAERLLARTGGNPLFLAGIVDRLVQADAPPDLAEAIATIPTGVRRYIERQIDELDDVDRELLMAGSVVRREFAAAAVAAARARRSGRSRRLSFG